MTDYELSKLADMMDEDAVTLVDFDPDQLLPQSQEDALAFKRKYLQFYDDIKTNPYDDW